MVSAADYLRKVLLSPVYEAARVTPLQTLKKLSERLGNHVSLKREDLQPVHSFKLRGAYHKIATLTEEQKSRGVIAASAGNHAQGVALSAAKLGIKAIIVMPKTTPDIKIDAVRRQGDPLGVVAGGGGDDAARLLLLGQGGDLVVGAAQLEGVDRLQILPLQADVIAEPLGEFLQGLQRGDPRRLVDGGEQYLA